MMTEDQKEEFKKIYRAFADTKDEVKERNAGMADLVKEFAKKIEVAPKILNKTLAYLYTKRETGEDMIADISQIVVELESEN